MKKATVENIGSAGDPDDKGISVWREEEENDPLTKATRNLNRNRAKTNLDKIIEGKIERLSEGKSEDYVNAALEEIAKERANRREIKEQQIKEADNRLDLFVDKSISKIISRPSAFFRRAGEKFKEKEACFSLKMASFVNNVDDFVNMAFYNTARFYTATRSAITEKRTAIKRFLHDRKRPIIAGISGMLVLSATFGLAVDNAMAYEYMYNGKVLGVVEDVDYVYDAIDVIGDKLSCTYDAEINICRDKDISFRKVAKLNREMDSIDDVLNRFTYMKDMTATAYAIVVNGQQKARLHNRDEAQEILNAIQAGYTGEKDGVAYESVDFAEDVVIKEFDTKLGNIQKKEDVLDYMLTGAVEVKTYKVKAGDTFGAIAKSLGMSQEELMSTNPDINPAKLSIDQELVLNRVRPVLTVQTTEIQEYIAYIDFDVTYEESASLFKGETAVKRAGVKGEKQVVARVVRNNGEEIDRVELQAEVISQPKDQIVVKGTKPLPPLIGTGVLQYPVRGRLTSRFGTRWGRMHNGIDLANPHGTKIRAADGGIVISAGWEGALGYCIKIDHGQNMSTVYGHCSKLLVKKGDKVYQGQHIANVGNTGRSTGPHLHFEVHIKGVPQNPLKYLK